MSGWVQVPVPWTRLCIFEANRFAEGVPPVQQVFDDYAFAFLRRKLLRQQALADAALDARDLCLDQRARTVAVFLVKCVDAFVLDLVMPAGSLLAVYDSVSWRWDDGALSSWVL
ncbi:hypothetical protein QF000_007924 [Paraburkholderia atlantica]|uniref:hypothetical protein n=1 Tax=Paraburkholderia atlantica TaxID=2654982 RepID=UPI003D1B068B